MKRPAKRERSPTDNDDDKIRKRRATEQVTTEDDEDDLESILAQIRQQEESEALARKLQYEWNNGSESNTGESSLSAIVIRDEGDQTLEDDEAFARRLAAEWAEEDHAPVENALPGPSVTRAGQRHVQRHAAHERNGKVAAVDGTPDCQLEVYREFFVGSRNCTECGHEIISPRGYVTYSIQVPPPSLVALLHIHCPNCQTTFCRGCSRVLRCSPSCKGKTKDKEQACPVMDCCAEVRAIALFEALGGFDRHYLGERATSASRSKEAMEKYRKANGGSVGPGGTGYGTGSHSGYGGYSSRGRGRGSGHGSINDDDHIPSRSMELVAHADVIIVRALRTITMLLPAPYSDAPQEHDILPHATIALLILTSHLPELLAALLRNDSVTDWTSRSDVYNAMLGLLRRMSDCELTLEVIIGQQHELEKSGGIEEWMWGETEILWVKSPDSYQPRTANPLYTYFQKLTKQCETFLSGASQMLESGEVAGEDIESIIKSISLCGEIIAARDDLERAMKAVGKRPAAPVPISTHERESSIASLSEDTRDDKGKSTAIDDSRDLEKRYKDECERLAFHHVVFPQENDNYSTFNYADLVRQTANSTRTPKDRLHMIKELAVMATSLPPGVWVRVDEVRSDVLKIMIAGPEGTPYAGGLFEFDCFLTLEYPHKPPQMHLRTTGGGSVRFNPNLYNNGKVCLSLLGTWAGRPEEQWSNKSTLLQVLVSIQSMILTDLPYFNEPGFGQANRAVPASIAYNKNIAVQTVRWAMVEWLKDENRTSMWADVIKTHFTLRARKIEVHIREWAEQESSMRAYVAGGRVGPTPSASGFLGLPNASTGGKPKVDKPLDVMGMMGWGNAPSSQGYAAGSGVGGGMDLLDEFLKGVERVTRWEEGSYTSP